MPKCLCSIGVLMIVSGASVAAGLDQFTPLRGDVGVGSLPEAAPYRLSSPQFTQRTMIARDPAQARRFDSGHYDMMTANETGHDAGRYLFMPFETHQAGIQRLDLRTHTVVTLWASPTAAPARDSYVAFDASRWTPWGSLLTGEESWSGRAGAPDHYGRLLEVVNPLALPGEVKLVHRNMLPRVAHEGLAFDAKRNLYFVDERYDGHVFRYTSAQPQAKNGDTFFAAGQSFVLRVGDGPISEAVGTATWIPLTDAQGVPLPGVVVVNDSNGLTAIDGAATPLLAAFRGTVFDRPEDIEIKTSKDGKQMLFVATTTQHKVFSIDLDSDTVKLFASQNTLDSATGARVGAAFRNPDNLAIDSQGNIYIVEDQPGGVGDIWFAHDKDSDGVAEMMGKWANLSTQGAESTGLYFDKFEPNVAYINVQHPDSGVDRTIMISAPGTSDTLPSLEHSNKKVTQD